MNRIEDRLRDAFGAAAETVRPESVSALHEASRPAGRRRLAPLAAAVAVGAVIVAASVITPLALAGGGRAPAAPGGATVPSPSASALRPGPGVISVPAVVGASVAQAEALLSAAGLNVTVQPLANATPGAGTVTEQLRAGTVMEQLPAGGSLVAPGARVSVLVAVSSGPSATITLPPPRQVSFGRLAVTLAIAQIWQPNPGEGPGPPTFYSGVDGFVWVSPVLGSLSLQAACTRAASQHAYGTRPQITYRSIDGRPGCLIVPSGDAPVSFRLYGGPALRESSLLVTYRRTLSFGDSIRILQISTDPAHLQQIVDSVRLHH